jgi:CHAT domain-containing protein/Tfp pilus assembly protein PilF
MMKSRGHALRAGGIYFMGGWLLIAATLCSSTATGATSSPAAADWPLAPQLSGEGSVHLFESAPQTTQGELIPLKPGEPLVRELAGAAAHRFLITLVKGQYMHVLVEQKGVDVVVSLMGQNRVKLIEVDNPNGMFGPESIYFVADASGAYEVEVSSTNKWRPGGSYRISVEEQDAPSEADLSRVRAARAFAEGQRLRFQTEAEARRAAISKYEEARSLWKALGETYEEAYTLCNTGRTYKSLGQLPAALENLNGALALLKAVSDKHGQVFMLNEIGASKRDFATPAQALEYYEQALTLLHELDVPDLWEQAYLLNNKGYAYARMGQHREALEYYELALSLWRSLGDREQEARTLNNLAGAYDELGESPAAIQIFEQLLEFTRAEGNKSLEAFVRNNLGKNYDTAGNWYQALDQYENALECYRQTGNHSGEALALDNIGMLYAGWNDPQRAMDYFASALRLQDESGDPQGRATSLNNMGYAQFLLGHSKEALNYYEQARALREMMKSEQELSSTLDSLGRLYASLGQTEKALDFYRQALAIQERLKDVRARVLTLDDIGQLYAQTGKAATAIDSFEKSIPLWQSVRDQRGEAMSLFGIAGVERARGNLRLALTKVESAIDLVESLRTTVSSPLMRLRYFKSKRNYYQFDIDLRMRLDKLYPAEGHAEEAFRTSERARTRALLDMLNEAQETTPQEAHPQLIAEQKRLEGELNDEALRLARLRSRKVRPAEAAVISQRIDELINQLDELQARIRSGHHTPSAPQPSQILSLKETQQQLLDDDTLLLEYALGEQQSYLWVITKTTSKAYPLPARVEIERAARGLIELLRAFEPIGPGESRLQYIDKQQAAATQYWQQSAALSRMILGPAAAQLGTKRLLVVADGVLQYLPFEALADPNAPVPSNTPRPLTAKESNSPAPLISKHEIVYQPSVSALAALRKSARQKATKDVAVFADPVFSINDERFPQTAKQLASEAGNAPGLRDLGMALRDVGEGGLRLERLQRSLEEANEIMNYVPASQGMKAIDFEAKRSLAMDPRLGQYRIIHFATHGVLDERHPELSGIVLSMFDEHGAPQNGFLRLQDIYHMKLAAELVVLSACRTGIGEDVSGEGLIGLTRGFISAGAARVVASLWNVEDKATAELMKRFYRHMLQDKMTAAAALRLAQLELMQTSDQWSAPYYWAGFVIQGDWK